MIDEGFHATLIYTKAIVTGSCFSDAWIASPWARQNEEAMQTSAELIFALQTSGRYGTFAQQGFHVAKEHTTQPASYREA